MEKGSIRSVTPDLKVPPKCQALCWDESDLGLDLLMVLVGQWEVNAGHCSVWEAPGATQAYRRSRFGRLKPEEGLWFWSRGSQWSQKFS